MKTVKTICQGIREQERSRMVSSKLIHDSQATSNPSLPMGTDRTRAGTSVTVTVASQAGVHIWITAGLTDRMGPGLATVPGGRWA